MLEVVHLLILTPIRLPLQLWWLLHLLLLMELGRVRGLGQLGLGSLLGQLGLCSPMELLLLLEPRVRCLPLCDGLYPTRNDLGLDHLLTEHLERLLRVIVWEQHGPLLRLQQRVLCVHAVPLLLGWHGLPPLRSSFPHHEEPVGKIVHCARGLCCRVEDALAPNPLQSALTVITMEFLSAASSSHEGWMQQDTPLVQEQEQTCGRYALAKNI